MASRYASQTDLELFDAWTSGDTEAAGELFERHYEAVDRFFRNKLLDGYDDLVQQTFAACLEANPQHPGARYDYGLMLSRLGEHAQALPLLIDRVDPFDPETPTDDLLSFAETLRATKTHERALDVTGEILRREPRRIALHAERAEILEGFGRTAEAEEELERYADGLGDGASPEEVAPIRQRLARSAIAREDFTAAIAQLTHARALVPTYPGRFKAVFPTEWMPF